MRWFVLACVIAFVAGSSSVQSVAIGKPHLAMFSIVMCTLSAIFAVFSMEAFDRAKVPASYKPVPKA